MKKGNYSFYKVLSERIDLGALSSVSYSLSNQTITGGIDVKQGSVDAKDVYYTSTDIVHNGGKTNTLGLFLQDEIKLLNEKLKVIAGLRFDYAQFFDGNFEIENPTPETTFMLSYQNDNIRDTWNALSPKISAQYELNNSSRVYASYAKGFRPAVLDDMSRSGRIRGGFKVANPSLKPEYLNNFEVGVDARFFQRLRTSVSAFYSMGDDFMYNVTTGDSINLGKLQPIIKASNISKVEIFGVEVEANYFLNDQLSVNANYALAHSQIKEYKPLNDSDPIDLTGNYLADVPSHTASISAFWRNKIVNTSIAARYTGSRWANDVNKFDDIIGSDKYPSYTTIDLKLSKSIKMMFVALNIQNIFDTKFYDGSGAVCPGRFMSLELGVRF
jgi:iron complex outermembrane receptor protein